MRRVDVTGGNLTLMDYCTGPSFASGGFIADSRFDGSTIVNGSQQQWLVRNSTLDGWTNGVWNQVFSGVVGAPAQCFPAHRSTRGPRRCATSPVTREKPLPLRRRGGQVPGLRPGRCDDSSGTTWANGPTPGVSIPIAQFYVAKPSDSASTINAAIHAGRNLLLTPGVYHLDRSIDVTRPDTVVLGLGFPTLVRTERQRGDDGSRRAKGIGSPASRSTRPASARRCCCRSASGRRDRSDNHHGDPDPPISLTTCSSGSAARRSARRRRAWSSTATTSILDDIWAWRADHGNGVGWTSNTADTGVVVNGDHVTAYGLFVEHYQKSETIWNGNGGTDVFFQNEMPYDPPSQAAWMEAPGVDGYPAFKVGDSVTSFHGYGMGSYSFFNQGVDIFAARAFEVPATLPPGSLNDLLTIFLSTAGSGGILNVVNDTGGSSTIANPDTPVTVTSYP